MMDLTGAITRDPDLHYCDEAHPDDPEVLCLREQEPGTLHPGLHSVPGTQVFWGQMPLLSRKERRDVQEAVHEGVDRNPATPPPTSAEAVPPRVTEDRVQMPHDPTDTQEGAGEATLPRSGTQRARVYDAIVVAGDEGLTDEEIQNLLGMNPSTVRPRRGELVQDEFVVDSGRRRRTASGEQAIVWVLRTRVLASTLRDFG